MMYSVGDKIKIDADRQTILDGYELLCPYVEVSESFNSLDDDRVRAYGDFYSTTSHRAYRRNAYSFIAEGSTLVTGSTEQEAAPWIVASDA